MRQENGSAMPLGAHLWVCLRFCSQQLTPPLPTSGGLSVFTHSSLAVTLALCSPAALLARLPLYIFQFRFYEELCCLSAVWCLPCLGEIPAQSAENPNQTGRNLERKKMQILQRESGQLFLGWSFPAGSPKHPRLVQSAGMWPTGSCVTCDVRDHHWLVQDSEAASPTHTLSYALPSTQRVARQLRALYMDRTGAPGSRHNQRWVLGSS